MLKRQRYENKKILQSAKGESCSLRFEGCKNDKETVVWCHSPFEHSGMAQKSDDFIGCYGCHHCHDILDGRKFHQNYNDVARFWHFHQAMKRSLRKLFDKGILK